MQVSNTKLHGNLSNESRADTCGQTDGQIWSKLAFLRLYKRAKISCDSSGVRHSRENCSSAWISGVKKQSMFGYLPLGVLIDICICQ